MFTTLLTLFLAAITLPPRPDHYVTDHAGVLPADRLESIDAKLKSFADSTSTQVIVYIDLGDAKGAQVFTGDPRTILLRSHEVIPSRSTRSSGVRPSSSSHCSTSAALGPAPPGSRIGIPGV